MSLGIRNVDVRRDHDEGDETVVIANIFAAERNDRFMEEVVARISIEPNVTAVSWEKSLRQ